MEHIKITDLSIGDWVMYDLQPYMIVSIDEESHHVIISGSDGWRDKHIDYIEPIHLTRRILEFNDIPSNEIDDDPLYIIFDIDGLSSCLEYKNSEYVFSVDGGYIELLKIKYVHQLQHVLRLAGIDKEITL